MLVVLFVAVFFFFFFFFFFYETICFSFSWCHFVLVVSSPEHEVLMVSYCGQSMSVFRRSSCVVRRSSSVVRRAASTIALKAYSFYTPGPFDSILDKKHQGDL